MMIQKAARSLRFVLLITVVLLAGVGLLYVADVMAAEAAKDLAVKTLLIMGIFAAASVAVVLISGRGESK